MNITFLIGNGFDRNLGLATTYAEFVKEYKKTPAETKVLQDFREYIKENEELWSAAEVALGLYTEQFAVGQAAAFSECHADICEELAKYLKKEQAKISYDYFVEDIQKAFSRINSVLQPFPTQEQAVLNGIYTNRRNEGIVFQFICFNYTETLDRCVEIAKKNPDTIGSHKYNNQPVKHSVGQLLHVHGTVDKEMVFGVNDDTQIARNEIFDCDDGDLYKSLLIKQRANASYLENTDAKAAKILSDSHVIYVYGMSIGATDKLWWERICNWLHASKERHVIIQKYKMPSKGVFPVKYQLAEREARREITQYCNFDNDAKREIESRIHITDDNIFGEIADIGKYDLIEEFEAATSEELEKLLESV